MLLPSLGKKILLSYSVESPQPIRIGPIGYCWDHGRIAIAQPIPVIFRFCHRRTSGPRHASTELHAISRTKTSCDAYDFCGIARVVAHSLFGCLLEREKPKVLPGIRGWEHERRDRPSGPVRNQDRSTYCTPHVGSLTWGAGSTCQCANSMSGKPRPVLGTVAALHLNEGAWDRGPRTTVREAGAREVQDITIVLDTRSNTGISALINLRPLIFMG